MSKFYQDNFINEGQYYCKVASYNAIDIIQLCVQKY